MANEQLRQAIDQRSESDIRLLLNNLKPETVDAVLLILKGQPVKGTGSKSALRILIGETDYKEKYLKGRWTR